MRSLRTSLLPSSLLVLAIFASALGCGKNDPFGRQPIKGFITWDGKPIKYGSISFEPAERQPAGAAASIRDGVFDIPRPAGPCPGKYDVWLHATDHPGERVDLPPPKEILPQKFLSKPPAQIMVEQVTDDKPNEFKFDLK